ncbi:transcriptional regulator [Roseibium sp. TrichSKD4]|nr:transcriptional regulator [Roseibium sp. TrichSKD4]
MIGVNMETSSNLTNTNLEEFPDRLKALIGTSSVLAFASKCELPGSTVRKYLDGSIPSLDKATQIARACNVSLEWLATGQGPKHPRQASEVHAADFIGIPRYDAHLSAGGGTWNADKERPLDHIPFTREFLAKRLHKSKPRDLVILMVNGDSMEPLINDDDIVMVDQSKKRLEDGIFAFVFDDLAKVKRFRTLANGDLEIRSDNPLYPPEVLQKEQLNDLNIIGKVVWCGHHFAR